MSFTYQELFDKAVKGVIEQGCQSIRSIGHSCAYRGDSGKKCAIGHLLTDEQIAKYQVQEGDTPTKFQVALLRELAPDGNDNDVVFFLESLQCAHDNLSNNNDFINRFKSNANAFAARFGLKGCE
jgi:hypothetical protein